MSMRALYGASVAVIALGAPAVLSAAQLAGIDAPSPFESWTPPSAPGAAAFGAIVLGALFLLLHVYRRKGFILHWMLGWMVIAVGQAVVAVDVSAPAVELALLGWSRFLDIAGILLLALGADSYQRDGTVGRRYLIGLLPLLLWFVLAPIALGERAAIVPGYLIGAAALAAGAYGYLALLRRARLVGAGLTGSTFALLAATHLWNAIVVSRSTEVVIPQELMVANALLFLFAALGMHVLVFEDMTYELRVANRQLQTAQEDLREQAITDPLTHCHNRRFFDEVIGRELQRHDRYTIPLSFLFVDVDRFKDVNDSLGHEAGDRLLQYVALFLRRNVREADHVFRWGGDEFLLMLSCRLDAAQRKAFELKEAFQGALKTATAPLPAGVGLSVGYSEVVSPDDDIMERVREADERMYADKLAAR